MEPYCSKSWHAGYFIRNAKNNAGLIENSRKLIQDLRNARLEIGDDCPSLVETATELDELDKSLVLVQQEDELHTAAVIKEIKNTILKVHYISETAVRITRVKKRAVEKKGPDAPIPKKHFHTFRPMPKWVIKDRDQLDKAILCAHVGLVRNMEGGLELQRDKLFELSAKVKEVLGIDLVLATRLRDTPTVIIDIAASEKEFKGEGAVEPSLKDVRSEDVGEGCAYDNITLSLARVVAGETGAQGWAEVAKSSHQRKRL
ncbi:hypothetical protein F53441_7792 [Fusarium austroafricanum]|uniref:Uncharacterized protein n=1 Tax=Fusarium austroafricanum TaxID=2364996 RepID=A0A8H4KFH9_9HYPO|nr:hypothetical protein F53441_7792 [Fusarium austroafricanum]